MLRNLFFGSGAGIGECEECCGVRRVACPCNSKSEIDLNHDTGSLCFVKYNCY
jgi:hypothetical protein